MRWILSLMILVTGLTVVDATLAQDCACLPDAGSEFAGGHQGQLYPYDQQDPWLHGQSQRVPSYGGFSSFRPYNYRHVVPQAQIAANWGATNGMTYSHQFFNRYRSSYLNGNLHSRTAATSPVVAATQSRNQSIESSFRPNAFGTVSLSNAAPPQEQATRFLPQKSRPASLSRTPAPVAPLSPIQVFPADVRLRN